MWILELFLLKMNLNLCMYKFNVFAKLQNQFRYFKAFTFAGVAYAAAFLLLLLLFLIPTRCSCIHIKRWNLFLYKVVVHLWFLLQFINFFLFLFFYFPLLKKNRIKQMKNALKIDITQGCLGKINSDHKKTVFCKSWWEFE